MKSTPDLLLHIGLTRQENCHPQGECWTSCLGVGASPSVMFLSFCLEHQSLNPAISSTSFYRHCLNIDNLKVLLVVIKLVLQFHQNHYINPILAWKHACTCTGSNKIKVLKAKWYIGFFLAFFGMTKSMKISIKQWAYN